MSSTRTTSGACSPRSFRNAQAISSTDVACSLSPSSERIAAAAAGSVGQGAELLDHLDNGPVCDLLAVGKAARSDDPRVHPLESLGDETRLADAGLAEHRHELARALGARALPRPTKELQLTRASDEGSVVRTVGRLPDREEAKRRHRLGLPFQGERRELLGLGRRADQRARRRADEHLARVSRLFQPGRDVHGIPGDQRADLARQDLARVHPDPCPELEFRHRIPHLRRRPQRAQGVVLVRDRDAEDRHDGVADELLDCAAVPLDDRLHPLEVPPQPNLEHLGIGRIAQRGRSRQVAEHDGYGLALLLAGLVIVERGAAIPAEGEALGVLLAAPAAQHHPSKLERLTSSC